MTWPSISTLARGDVVRRVVLYGILGVHTYLLAYGAVIHSPARDEVAHLPAGLSHWELKRFDLYRVNPPLVRSLAALPVYLMGAHQDWRHYSTGHLTRSDFSVGNDFMAANGCQAFFMFTVARWMCIPLSLATAVLCYRWARMLYGPFAGLAAASLWCFCPEVISNAQMITPDTGAAALGFWCWFAFSRWMAAPSVQRAVHFGVWLGLAQLAKSTWVLLFPLSLLCWIVSRTGRGHRLAAARQAGHIMVAFTMGVYVLNAGYLFEFTGEPLGAMNFASHSLSGTDADGDPQVGNRFSGTFLAELPVLLPRDYVYGIDYVRFEFERGYASFLRGEWKHGGWWYYYLYAMAVKLPLGTIALAGLSGVSFLASLRRVSHQGREMFLLAPAVAVLGLVSSQTGFNHHLRYVLPSFPFLIVFSCRVFRPGPSVGILTRFVAGGLLIASMTSSLAVYPHSHSYFNALAGGPLRGSAHLLNSNIDWGQDVLLLRAWMDRHPEANQLGYASFCNFDPRWAGIPGFLPPPDPRWSPTGNESKENLEFGPKPGWYALSINCLKQPDRRYAYFGEFEPVARVGYATFIYHLAPDDTNRVRCRLGLAPILPVPEGLPEGPLENRTPAISSPEDGP